MADNIVSNPTNTVNRESLLNLTILLKKTGALARLLFECNIVEFEAEDPACQYLWALVDNVIVAEEQLDTILGGVVAVNGAFAQSAHRRLTTMLQIATQMRQLMQNPNFTQTIQGLKQQLSQGVSDE